MQGPYGFFGYQEGWKFLLGKWTFLLLAQKFVLDMWWICASFCWVPLLWFVRPFPVESTFSVCFEISKLSAVLTILLSGNIDRQVRRRFQIDIWSERPRGRTFVSEIRSNCILVLLLMEPFSQVVVWQNSVWSPCLKYYQPLSFLSESSGDLRLSYKRTATSAAVLNRHTGLYESRWDCVWDNFSCFP